MGCRSKKQYINFKVIINKFLSLLTGYIKPAISWCYFQRLFTIMDKTLLCFRLRWFCRHFFFEEMTRDMNRIYALSRFLITPKFKSCCSFRNIRWLKFEIWMTFLKVNFKCDVIKLESKAKIKAIHDTGFWRNVGLLALSV